MICKMAQKAKRTYQLDADVVTLLDQWSMRTRVGPSAAASLGLYLVMQLTAEQREELIGHMDARESVDVLGLAAREESGAASQPGTGDKPGPAKRRDAG